MKKKFFILLAVLFLLTFIPVASLYATATSISYIGASWNHDPVTVYISLQKGVDPSYLGEVNTALNDWKIRLGSNFNFQISDSPQSKRIPGDISIQIKKNTGAVLGSTQLSSSGESLSYAKIVLASQNAMGKALDKADFRNILRHELGHALGLGHANDNGSDNKDLMYPYYDYIEVGYDVFPSVLDISALINLYGNDGFVGTNLSPIPQMYP